MVHAKKILITGATGMIGTRLTSLLLEKGHEVSHLSRSQKAGSPVPVFVWDPARKEIDQQAIKNIDVIIHLAGAGIADKRWTEERKEEILQSRTLSANLIRRTITAQGQHQVKVFISASGVDYYGTKNLGAAFIESSPPGGEDFMSQVAIAWEKEADAFCEIGMRVVKIRTGVVLSRESIALRKISLPVKLFVGAPLGTGDQYFNWIHLEDLCEIYLKAIEDSSMQGAYNAVAPTAVTNRELTKEIANVLSRPLWLPAVPGFVVRLIAGEVADVVLKGGKVSADKIQQEGFDFRFNTLRSALKDIFDR